MYFSSKIYSTEPVPSLETLLRKWKKLRANFCQTLSRHAECSFGENWEQLLFLARSPGIFLSKYGTDELSFSFYKTFLWTLKKQFWQSYRKGLPNVQKWSSSSRKIDKRLFGFLRNLFPLKKILWTLRMLF